MIENTVEEISTPKKRPGRPRKVTTTIHSTDIDGLVSKPTYNDENIVELVYDNPQLFKKIIGLFKSFEVADIEFWFYQDYVRIIAEDHTGKSFMYVDIRGSCMSRYYCVEPVYVCVQCESLEKVLGVLTKNHHRIIIYLNKHNYRSSLYILIKDAEYNNDDVYEIDLIQKQQSVTAEHCDRDYPIQFTISSRHFKTRITHVSKLSPTITIQKQGTKPLQMTFDKSRNVNWHGIYTDGEKIGLRSDLAPDESFNVTIFIDHIRPFSNAVMGDEILISLDKKKSISFTTKMDDTVYGHAATLKLFTEIQR